MQKIAEIIIRKAAPHHMDAEKLELLLFLSGGAIEGFMNRAIDALIERYESVESYLERELGIGAAEREILRERFLVSSAGH